MTLYAPGGEFEKTVRLNKLQNPTRCTDAQGMGAMEESCSGPGVVDARAYHFGKGCCCQPCEQLASLSPVRKGVVASSPSRGTGLTPNPKAKSLQPQGPDPNEKPPKAKTPCTFFGKRDTGCSRGRKCPYLHSWDGVPEKPPRCRECSSTKHFAKDCPTKANDAGNGKGKGKDGTGNQTTNQDPNQNNTNLKGPPSNKKVLIERGVCSCRVLKFPNSTPCRRPQGVDG